MRRQETKRKNSQPFWKRDLFFPKATRKKTKKSDLRFDISLVVLIALLSASTYIFLLVLVRNQNRAYYQAGGTFVGDTKANWNGKVFSGGQVLEDESLGFKLAMPRQLGSWMYKIGYVKSPTDDSLSDQYVKIYVPLDPAAGSNNFEKQYQDILTIRKFSSGEWKELEKGCGKKNLVYCEEAGTKIDEKGGSVYVYTKAEKCPNEIAPKCVYIDGIIRSFKLN